MRNGFTLGEVDRAIAANDCETLNDLFNYVNLTDHVARTRLTSATHKLVYEALGSAASLAYSNGLHGETATFLIDRAYSCTSVFSVATSAALALGCYGADIDPGIIPKKVRRACMNKTFNDDVAAVFADMSEEEFKALLAFISSGKVSSIDKEFSHSILAYMYMHDTIETSMIMSIMASTLGDIDDGPNLGSILAFSMLGALRR